VTEQEKEELQFRRSLYIVEDMKVGDVITEKNMRSIRPGLGLAPKYYEMLLGKHVNRDIERGTPVDWSIIGC
ncbi:MAG: pseudaminic acid synthase, partial [Anaerovibrio sp.]|uniref:SAF domain-containing protein n=1 Tax=Anaerovibrio sp. TaxID=1872532 RepID=UPI001B155147